MGYNTTLMVLMDRWHEAVNNPQQWVESVDREMREGGTAIFQTTVIKTAHADVPRLYLSWENTLREFNVFNDLLDKARSDPAVLQRLKEDTRMARDLLSNFEQRLYGISTPS